MRFERIAAALIAAVTAFGSPGAAFAQLRPPLVAVQVFALDTGATRVLFEFAASVAAPSFRVVRNGAATSQVIFANAGIAPAAAGRRIAGIALISSVICHAAGGDVVCDVFAAQAVATSHASTSGSAVQVDFGGPPAPANQPKIAPPVAQAPPAAPRSPGTSMRVFRLRYADVAEVANLLVAGSSLPPSDVFSPTPAYLGQPSSTSALQFGASQAPGSAAGAATALQPQSARLNDSVSIDRRLNTIIVSGTAEQIARAEEIVRTTDVPVTSIMLEAEIVELTESASRDLGIDFSPQGTFGQTTFSARSLSVPTATASFTQALYAQIAKGNGRIVAKPRIMTLSGTTASILTGDAIPIITTISLPSTGSSFVQQQVQYINVGVTLEILPRFAGNGTVIAKIYSAVSSVTGFVQGVPQISQREATTAASVRSGVPLIIGGLLQDSEIKNLTRVPGISSLPLIGGLFKLARETHQSTSLYIILTPYVMEQEESER
jgi:general secretion pathway protein D